MVWFHFFSRSFKVWLNFQTHYESHNYLLDIRQLGRLRRWYVTSTGVSRDLLGFRRATPGEPRWVTSCLLLLCRLLLTCLPCRHVLCHEGIHHGLQHNSHNLSHTARLNSPEVYIHLKCIFCYLAHFTDFHIHWLQTLIYCCKAIALCVLHVSRPWRSNLHNKACFT